MSIAGGAAAIGGAARIFGAKKEYDYQKQSARTAQAAISQQLSLLPFNIQFAEMQRDFALGSARAQRMMGELAQNMANIEAENIEMQANISEIEHQIEAQRVAREGRKFLGQQSVSYLKNGVVLAGSPLLVLEETKWETHKQVRALENRGALLKSQGYIRAEITRAEGTARMLGANIQAAATAFEGGAAVYQAHMQNASLRSQLIGQSTKLKAQMKLNKAQFFSSALSGLTSVGQGASTIFESKALTNDQKINKYYGSRDNFNSTFF